MLQILMLLMMYLLVPLMDCIHLDFKLVLVLVLMMMLYVSLGIHFTSTVDAS